ncbi:hypothetical protein BOX15_Mlig017803g1, partial [Macrostomum lignano]
GSRLLQSQTAAVALASGLSFRPVSMHNDESDCQSMIEQSAAIVCLTAIAESHPFSDRFVPVPRLPASSTASSSTSAAVVRIGRASGQLRPAKDNALFDCKVLSRCHAVLAYTTDGTFLLTDTRSSNGTFVNGIRLDRNRPTQILTGDAVQFGVPVKCRDKPVFDCIRARLELRHPDGETAPSRSRTRVRQRQSSSADVDDTDDAVDDSGVGRTELLARCLERAMQRERLLDLKLACLRRRQQQQGQELCPSVYHEPALRLSWRRLSADGQAVARLKSLATDAREAGIVGDVGDGCLGGVDLAEISNAAAEAWLAELDRGLAEREAIIGRLTDLEAQLELGGRECQHLLARCDQIAGMLSGSSTAAADAQQQSQLEHSEDTDNNDLVANIVGRTPATIDTLAVGVQISLVEELLDYVLDKTGICLDAVSNGSASGACRPVEELATANETPDTADAAAFDIVDDGQTLRRVIRRHHYRQQHRQATISDDGDAVEFDRRGREYDDDDVEDLEADEDRRLSESLLATERRVSELISRLDAEQRRYLASGAELGESAQQLLEEMRQQARWLDESLLMSNKATASQSCGIDRSSSTIGFDWRQQIAVMLWQELPSISALVLLISLTVYLLFYWL